MNDERPAYLSTLMTGPPPFGSERLVTLRNWQDPPWNRWSFQHLGELVPSARIRRGPGPARELPRNERDVLAVQFDLDGRRTSVGELLDDTQTDAFLVLHRGTVRAEHYFNHMAPDTPHLLMSVSKSITAAVAGRLVERGAFDVEAPVTDLVPELGGTSFDGATVQQLLDMRTGTHFDEDYDSPESDVRTYEEIYLMRPHAGPGLPPNALSYFESLHNDGEHGGPFRYRSILIDVLAWVLERAGGERFHELVSKEIWGPIGAEFDAEITLDAYGNSMADGGISACLRDVGRFGLSYLPGSPYEGVVPRGWVEDTIRGSADGPESFVAGDNPPGFPPGSHYRNCWWVRDAHAPFLAGSGIYGQHLFVHGPTETVVVKLSTWPTPLNRRLSEVTAAAALAIGEELAQEETVLNA
jgi:CubicO group peptidase (beta-lactamase class C family)